MTKTKGVRQLVGVTGTALTGVLFFFIIVGVFGPQIRNCWVTGVCGPCAVAIYRAFPEGVES